MKTPKSITINMITNINYCNLCHCMYFSRVCKLLMLKHTLFSTACFSFSTLAKVSSRSSMSFFSSEHSSSSFLFLAVSSAFRSSSSSSLSLNSLALASSKILFLISPSHRSSASARLSLSCLIKNDIYNCSDALKTALIFRNSNFIKLLKIVEKDTSNT